MLRRRCIVALCLVSCCCVSWRVAARRLRSIRDSDVVAAPNMEAIMTVMPKERAVPAKAIKGVIRLYSQRSTFQKRKHDCGQVGHRG